MWRYVMVCALGGLLVGCAGAKPIGSLTEVQSSGSKPDWLNKRPADTKQDIFWVCSITGADSEDGGTVDAREDCMRQLADFLNNTSEKLYEKARVARAEGMDFDAARPYVNDAYKAWYTKANSSGLRMKEKHWVRWEKIVDKNRVKYLYDVAIIMEMNKKQLDAIGQEAFAEQVKKARAKNDAEAARTLEVMQSKLKSMSEE